jgi:hypothetical protein
MEPTTGALGGVEGIGGMMALDMVQVPRAVSSHVGGVQVRSRRAVHILVRVDCRRRSTVPR